MQAGSVQGRANLRASGRVSVRGRRGSHAGISGVSVRLRGRVSVGLGPQCGGEATALQDGTKSELGVVRARLMPGEVPAKFLKSNPWLYPWPYPYP